MMNPLERVVLVISADAALAETLVETLTLKRGGSATRGWAPPDSKPRTLAGTGNETPPPVVPFARSLEQARARMRRARPAVVVLDAAAVPAESCAESLAELLEVAPVIVLSGEEPAADFGATLFCAVAAGKVDCVARAGASGPLLAALIERRLRAAGNGASREDDFAEILRHEVNNPLTGILGNAELLLARSRSVPLRNRLPAAFVQRLETIAELAVRLRESVRRLTDSGRSRAAAASPLESRRRTA